MSTPPSRYYPKYHPRAPKPRVQTLTVISSIGVISGIINYLTFTKLPKFSSVGLKYFLILLSAALLVNALVAIIYRSIRYE